MRLLSVGTRVHSPIRATLRATRLIKNIKPLCRSQSARYVYRIPITWNSALAGPERFSAPNGSHAPIDMVRVPHRIPYGAYTAEKFVRIRVAGAFFIEAPKDVSFLGRHFEGS